MTDIPNYVPCLAISMFGRACLVFGGLSIRAKRSLHGVAGLLERARDASVPNFHVQHDGGPGHILAMGSIGWPNHTDVQPRSGEAIIEKRYSSAFHDTDFHARLTEAGVDRLVVAGIQTGMCVDSTCRAAVALGYKVTLVWDAHTTFDSPCFQEKRSSHITTGPWPTDLSTWFPRVMLFSGNEAG